MKNKYRILFFVLILSFFVIESREIYARTQIHPRNRMLVSKGLVPRKILKYFPEVPKITPTEAWALYKTKKAVFIAIGHDAPRLMDGWLLEDYMHFNPKRLKAYGIPRKGRLIVLY